MKKRLSIVISLLLALFMLFSTVNLLTVKETYAGNSNEKAYLVKLT